MANKTQTEKNILLFYPELPLASGQYVPGVGAIPIDSAGLETGTSTNPVITRSKQLRTPGVLHRTGVVAVDKLSTPTAVTTADVTTGGVLLAGTAYKSNIAANTIYGPTICPTAASVTTAADASNTHVIRITTTQVAGATSYDIFCSTDAAPLWVARVTEAERAAGVTITAVGTVNATSPGANKIDVRVVGTGVASTAVPFSVNNAVVTSGITPIDCTGYTTALVYAQLTVTDLRSAPSLSLNAFTTSRLNPGVYVQTLLTSLTMLSSVGNPLYRIQTVTVAGTLALVVLVDTLAGQGASVDIYVDLV